MEYIILWILALFGLWSLISNILESFYSINMEGLFEVRLNVYNQEDTIEILLKQLSRVDMVGKIIILDNGSTDRTVDIIKEMQKENKKIIFSEGT